MLVGEGGYGDEFGIGSPESYTIKEIAKMYGDKMEILPERKGSRTVENVITSKIEVLDWKPTHLIKEYINESKNNNWK